MSFALDVLYVLICLAVIIGGLAFLAHQRGSHEHAPDCRPCRAIHRVLRTSGESR